MDDLLNHQVELLLGGYTNQWVKNGGKCGVCGDPWNAKVPRAHEYGGTFGQGVIVRQYTVGSVITIRVELTASHFGYFTFSVCPEYKNVTQECLDKNILKNTRSQDGLVYSDIRFYPRDGSKVYEMKYKLPKMQCSHCVLQWRYIAGNNWGMCPNGTEQVGCGPQEEFRACADIAIGKLSEEAPITTTSTTVTEGIPESEETYSPISAIVIAVVSFLLVSLIFFLLYFHYYQIGGRIKNWIKPPEDNQEFAPQPPPRVKRSQNRIDL
ncbi:hypothetical protein RN001_010278 [Aquatica leii]|uniref:Chitin-binding type-4 domain-containing protein n=1 Tax=Aquatica leii TaxID=1421715 RepID=A0AAN7SEC7_9COLE|nr:hypothetical protein RN001_010278 [Aquatica leii]